MTPASTPGTPFDVVIEIPAGAATSTSTTTTQHVIRLDRRLFSATVYPSDYGFVPDTLALDGDPLDVLVLLEDPTFPGCWVEVRAVGVFWMEDEKGPDAKILCVPSHDPNYDAVSDIADLPKRLLDEIEHFFDVYKMLEPEKNSRTAWLRGARRGLRGDRGVEVAVPELGVGAAERDQRRRGCRSRRPGRRRPRRSGRRCARSGAGARSGSWCGRATTTPIARCTRASVPRSRLEVASSSSRIAGSTSCARARHDELALPGGQRPAPLADRVEVAAGERGDEVVRAHGPRRALDLGVGGVGAAVGDVVADRAREQERLLGHEAELAAVRAQVEVAHGRRRRRGRRRSRVVEAGDQLHQRRLAGAGLADERDRLARRRCARSTPRSVSRAGRAGTRTARRRSARRRAARPGTTGSRGVGRGHVGVCSSSLIGHRRHRLLLLVEHLRELLDRREEQVEVEQERDQVPAAMVPSCTSDAAERRARSRRRSRRGTRRTGSRSPGAPACGAGRRGSAARSCGTTSTVRSSRHVRLRHAHAGEALLELGVHGGDGLAGVRVRAWPSGDRTRSSRARAAGRARARRA